MVSRVRPIMIGLILGITAILLAYETKGLLIGESADKTIVQGIRKLAGAYDEIEHVNEVLTMHVGPDFILVNISVDFVDSLTAGIVEEKIAALNDQIKKELILS